MVKDGEIGDNCPITREFLESILKRPVLDFKMGGGSNPGDNFTSILISLEIRLVGQDQPLHLLFKTFPHHPTRQKLLEDSNLFLKEYLMYKTWIPELVSFQTETIGNEVVLTPAVPKLVAGRAIDYENDTLNMDADPVLNNFILMVDERKTNGFRMADKLKSLGYFHVKTVLDEVAKLHALGHAYKVHKNLPNIRTKFSFMTDPFFCNPNQKATIDAIVKMNLGLLKETVESFLTTHSDIEKAISKLDDEGQASNILYMFLNPDGVDEEKMENLMRVKPASYCGKPPLKDQWVVCGHGDCYVNNALFKTNGNGNDTENIIDTLLVDLQIARESCIMADIVYLIYTSTDTDFRKKHLNEMLHWYFERFAEYCKLLKVGTFPGYTWENFERKFHRSKLLGFLFHTIVCPIILTKPETAVDLDTVEVETGSLKKEDEFADMIQKSSTRDDDDKNLLRDRFASILLEMYEDGIL